ncbi:MAG: methylenetetrahydrofolate reductase C-terminal domain-containing protein [Chloroflexota bacterium]
MNHHLAWATVATTSQKRLWLRLLEGAYDGAYRLLRPFRRRLKPGGAMEAIFIHGEQVSKGALFGCQMCGQCVLHQTGMTCPMNCPKQLRNGPCGGVRPDGHCEVIPDMPCVWVKAWERAQAMPVHGQSILAILPPVNHQLEGTSAWINEFSGAAHQTPPGWG